MKDLVEYIVKSIVTNPEDVVVLEEREGDVLRLNLSVNPADMGVVIGKSGQNVKSIRKIITVRAITDGVKVYLNIQEPDKQ